jgi:hypothetical protein
MGLTGSLAFLLVVLAVQPIAVSVDAEPLWRTLVVRSGHQPAVLVVDKPGEPELFYTDLGPADRRGLAPCDRGQRYARDTRNALTATPGIVSLTRSPPSA